ncbi:MAG: lipoate protein ligase C-terminal domain-containing protein [Candidatus Thorarchaeota archaeon]
MESQEVIKISYYAHKVAGGKLIKVKVESEDGLIQAITLLGDFFLHPEYVLEEIEASLKGVHLSETALTNEMQKVMERSQATLIGASVEDFAQAIMSAWMASNRNS